jgi:hypothetical protein
MDTRKSTQYSDMIVGIFYTEHDFLACREESEAAISWYRRRGFRNLHTGIIQGMGHERTPETAAAIFANTCERTAQASPKNLIRIKVLADSRIRALPEDAIVPLTDKAILHP